jgi:uncharacterized protein YcfL
MKLFTLLAALALAAPAVFADDTPPMPPAPGSAASKIMLRGDSKDIKVVEIRAQRKNDVLVIQADMQNQSKSDRFVYYRFRWLDSMGSQVGDDQPWKQLAFMGQQLQTIKGVATQSNITDFRIEMNVESK